MTFHVPSPSTTRRSPFQTSTSESLGPSLGDNGEGRLHKESESTRGQRVVRFYSRNCDRSVTITLLVFVHVLHTGDHHTIGMYTSQLGVEECVPSPGPSVVHEVSHRSPPGRRLVGSPPPDETLPPTKPSPEPSHRHQTRWTPQRVVSNKLKHDRSPVIYKNSHLHRRTPTSPDTETRPPAPLTWFVFSSRTEVKFVLCCGPF